jgi:hypothetical protein
MIGRRQKLPPEVQSQLMLGPKERVLAWADDGHGRPVVASETALHLQRMPPEYSRITWDQIEHARYDEGVLVLALSPELGSATLRIPVGQGRELPVAVRDRVTSSVVVDRFVELRGEHGVRIIGRRTDAGGVVWRTDLDPMLSGDPAVDAEVQTLLDEVKSEIAID